MFRDECSGPHCSNVCPEEISLETSSGAVVWSGAARIAIAAIVVLISIVCLVTKVSFSDLTSIINYYHIHCSSTVLSGSSISVGSSRNF